MIQEFRPMFFDQSPFEIRFEWGQRGLEAVASNCTTFVIVDVFSFCTSVSVAVEQGAEVLPCRQGDAARVAEQYQAVLALENRSLHGRSLSPTSLADIPRGTRLVLPSQNGSTLSRMAADIGTTYAGCFRNASAIATAVQTTPRPIAVIAAGERWPDGSVRHALEDLIGAGAIIAGIPGRRSPEAMAAMDAFLAARDTLEERIRQSASGRELMERGFSSDIDYAAAFNATSTIPWLVNEAFVGRHECK